MSTSRNPVGWFEIYVDDMARAKAFYSKTLQVEFQRLNTGDVEMWAFPMNPDTAGAPGALVKTEKLGPGVGGTIVYFSCIDCGVTAADAVKHGGRLERAKFSIGEYGFIAFVQDTEGNMIGLHSRK